MRRGLLDCRISYYLRELYSVSRDDMGELFLGSAEDVKALIYKSLTGVR